MMLLAAIELTDPKHFAALGWLLVGLFTLAGFVLIGLQIYSHIKTKPPLHKEYATKKELAALERKVTGEFSDLKTDLKTLRKEVSDDGEKRTDKLLRALDVMRTERDAGQRALYARINSTDAEVNLIKGEMNARRGAPPCAL